ncbi:MAG: oligosaccharide flippase family protein, partial [Erysipelotrichaceae bacterium]|nr:oligosaccharide flippase family protein [Erysipelotrichaceae bacterium]
MTQKKLKQSVLVGALTSSFGIFISKALGLLYYSPLSALAGEENMAFYSIVYTYYDLLLKISSAGIPFAIAALVARYCAKEDYKTALLVKKLGISLIMGLSVTVAFVFFLIATPLARQSMGSQASPEDIANLRNIFYILLVAVIFVPYLSAIRGYYQGLKRLDLYASSQVLEQFV